MTSNRKLSAAKRRDRGLSAYASQFDCDASEVEAHFTTTFGTRFAEEAFNATGGSAWHDGALERKYRGLVVIGILAALGGLESRLVGHVKWALANGATPEDVETVMLLVANYAGFGRASVGLEAIGGLLTTSEENG